LGQYYNIFFPPESRWSRILIDQDQLIPFPSALASHGPTATRENSERCDGSESLTSLQALAKISRLRFDHAATSDRSCRVPAVVRRTGPTGGGPAGEAKKYHQVPVQLQSPDTALARSRSASGSRWRCAIASRIRARTLSLPRLGDCNPSIHGQVVLYVDLFGVAC